MNNMESLGSLNQLLPVVAPVLLISIGYVDPGKWAATVEGGAHFGFELVALMLLFNFAAILCQYLSARIGLVTGRDLARICWDEYDKFTCFFLGVQTELSVIALDLTMILGLAHGLNLLFGWDLLSCVFLTAISAVLFPLFTILLEISKTKFLCVCISGFILLSVVLGVLISQTEVSLSMNLTLTKLCGENAFALMSLLGANIMPHNFYLHSSIVQQPMASSNISKDALCHKHFVAILSIFSCMYLVNYVLMVSAANVFHSANLVLLTFQDAMTLMEQVFASPVAPTAYLLILFCSNLVTSLTWSQYGQLVLHEFLRLDIPGWLHCATIRVIAVVPALYCVWSSGAEGMYQLLIFAQVMVALLLPSSVIPLFRVAASRPIMGVYKISHFVEFLAIITFIGMLGLKVMFIVEMILGNGDWVGNLRWNMAGSLSFSYVVFVVTAFASLCLMLWLLATPLKSANVALDAQISNWVTPDARLDLSTDSEETNLTEAGYHGEAPVLKQEPLSTHGKKSHSDMPVVNFDLDLPETIMEPDQEFCSNMEENLSSTILSSSPICTLEESAALAESVPVSTVSDEVSDVKMLDDGTAKTESMDTFEKTLGVEGELQTEKDDDEGDTWEAEASKGVSGGTPSLTSEGPGSFRSHSGKGDEGGSGAGSLSRLAGLGRAARRQLTIVLDEFWGQLYDFYGQATQESKSKKLDVFLGVDSKSASTSLIVDTTARELSGCFPSVGGRGSDNVINSSLYGSPKQQNVQRSLESSYGFQRGTSSLWLDHTQLLDAYVQNSSRNVDLGERRYSSVHNIPSFESLNNQPATVHGYQIASYGMAKERNSDHPNNQMDAASLAVSSYRDSIRYALGQNMQNGLSSDQASGYQNLATSRESPLHSERPYYDLPSGPAESVVSSANTKKYHSLPDMSGFSIPPRDLYLPDESTQWDSPVGYGSSVGRTGYPNSGSREGPLAFNELSPSKVYRGGFSSQLNPSIDTGSLWFRQPYEQFGVADKNRTVGSEGLGSRLSSITQEATSIVDSEAKLLQRFRHCIVRLLKLEGSDWLFSQNDGADEDLIDRVAARERFLYEAETREINRVIHRGEPQYLSSERKSGTAMRTNEASFNDILISSVPHCGEGCVWRSDLIVSFGVWCIHRILDLSLMESRPELWGKYTYVLNRLQGIIDLAFTKPRTPMAPCFCLQIPVAFSQKTSPPVSNGMLPPASKPGRGKYTTAGMLLDTIKDVEIAISCRKGRTGTAAGDVAYPKGKENLASVLKRYKRRLSNKSLGAHDSSGPRKVLTSTPYSS